ncbi:hypothetical protein EX30DRAFT_372174 [Ascodesmis nigricans]|uniref:Membrane anchor Opy2 N-terminal domain-containing protein n=1 Tax=Ascodesmis nigricans TaxID=341454 RepID=A0A4S2MVA7_9PEZI|nr:hypothetical protein EX30DRAFT_372174 [Ascodesmis nigricans]
MELSESSTPISASLPSSIVLYQSIIRLVDPWLDELYSSMYSQTRSLATTTEASTSSAKSQPGATIGLAPECSPIRDDSNADAGLRCPSACPISYIVSNTEGTPITWCSSATPPDVDSTGTLATGAKAGIVVGAIAGALASVGFLFFLHRRRGQRRTSKRTSKGGEDGIIRIGDLDEKPELDGYAFRHEIDGAAKAAELIDLRKFELSGIGQPAELEGSTVNQRSPLLSPSTNDSQRIDGAKDSEPIDHSQLPDSDETPRSSLAVDAPPSSSDAREVAPEASPGFEALGSRRM